MLAIDLFCGLGGWTAGLLTEGYTVIGFDMERHDYGTGGYSAQLVLQDVLTLHGRQFKDATLIVASPPCQEYSYMAMPWSKAKDIAKEYRSGARDTKQLTALFDTCFRIQREASEAAGHHIPLIVENVRGAIPWVGRSRWNYGSYHLWGDVPALMPMTMRRPKKNTGGSWFGIQDCRAQVPRNDPRVNNNPVNGDTGFKSSGMNWHPGNPGQDFTRVAGRQAEGQKTVGHISKRDGHGHTRHLTNQAESDHVKQSGIAGVRDNGKGDKWFQDGAARSGSKSKARKAASAAIAKIPFHLAQYIAHHFKAQ